MSQLSFALIAAVLGLQGLYLAASAPSPSDQQLLLSDAAAEDTERTLEYALKRGGSGSLFSSDAYVDSRERRAAGSGMGSSFIRFGRGGAGPLSSAVSQPHTRSDIIIRYGRDGLNGRLTRLRQERMRRLARLALICAAKNQEESPASSAEEKILREICKDAPLHPTVPDFV